eukprot:CAMPEP_0202455688 /NCGR_PEP_ID=MMETSP1360-20130828/13157_1 /ASSEMBLY_ACC=CAM_ASM_000848 /TAXON_ID=515479 /ORGANISM="Licmophora paradoxa, Strain CCMP2313" /LENGTH=560 /DNA_ID=CAMNT_0049075327 /DNA_START=33 /DNA_END=1715 /DNA_ORIENTATION=+
MKRLSVVAFAIGIDATLNDFIPYLQKIALKHPPQEDEVLLIMGQQMQLLVPTLLKQSPHLLPLLPILERLATLEETVVRDEAVKATNHIAPFITNEPSTLLNMTKRLVSADWFTAKVSAAGICATVYQVTKDEELRYLFRDLCQDETPMVRRAAAINLGKFLNQLTVEGVTELKPILEALCKDPQDSVRLLAVASLKDLAPTKLDPTWTTQVLLPILKNGSTDLSWRVRNNLAKSFSDVAKALNLNSTFMSQKTLVMACFVSLLQDQEGEVRAAAVGHLAPMVHWGGAALFQTHLQSLLPALADDVVVEVRSKCALGLMDSTEGATLEDQTIVRAFTPLLENFLQDEYSEVQLHVLNNLSRISHLLPQMSGVVSAILNMSKASNWRVRQGVAKLLPHLASARGMDFFTSVLLEPAWIALLLDPVASVRTSCVNGLPQLVKVSGEEWMVSTLLPQHFKIYDHASSAYLIRMTVLRGHGKIATASQSGSLFYQVVDHLLRGLKDKVANVRLATSKSLLEICSSGECDESVVASQIRPAIEQAIQTEQDPDCQQYMQECLMKV